MSDKESVTKKTWRMETAALIDFVQHRPCLWDRTHPHYRTRVEKDRAWAEIYRALEPAYDDMPRADRHEFGQVINRKWYNIRDCYKKYRNGSSRANVSGRPYVYADRLTFLDPMYDSKEQHGKTNGNYRTKDSTGEPENAEQEEWLNEVFVDMETADEPEPKRIKTEFARGKEPLDPEENIVSVLVNLIQKEEDEDRAFFKSIIPTVKSLSDDDKFVFRIRVMKLLNELKKREKRRPSLNRERLSQESDLD